MPVGFLESDGHGVGLRDVWEEGCATPLPAARALRRGLSGVGGNGRTLGHRAVDACVVEGEVDDGAKRLDVEAEFRKVLGAIPQSDRARALKAERVTLEELRPSACNRLSTCAAVTGAVVRGRKGTDCRRVSACQTLIAPGRELSGGWSDSGFGSLFVHLRPPVSPARSTRQVAGHLRRSARQLRASESHRLAVLSGLKRRGFS